MSDFAAVRIHSKIASIFSSRPIISRKRCTDGDDSSMPRLARPSRKISSSFAMGSCSGWTAPNRSADRRRCFFTTPNSTSSLTQLSTSRRMRPNACMMVSLSKDSPGRALRKRRMPARSGDCTSDLEARLEVERLRPLTCPDVARRAEKVTSSTRHLEWPAAARRPIHRRLILLDQLFHSHRIGLAMAVARDRRRAAAGFDNHVREQQVGIDAHRGHVHNMYRMFFSAENLRRVVNDRRWCD